MSGKPGRSGRRRKPLQTHLLNGSYRRDRHGPLPDNVRAMPAAASPVPAPSELLEGLAGRGLGFVEACWAEYHGWTVPTLALLHEAGRLLDELETIRGQRGERAAQRMLLAVLGALHLETAR